MDCIPSIRKPCLRESVLTEGTTLNEHRSTLQRVSIDQSELKTFGFDPFDEGGRLFTSFILHVFRVFQRLEWIDLPGPLPEE